MHFGTFVAAAIWVVVPVACAIDVAAQSNASADSALAAPRLRYEAGPLQRLLLGTNNRELWGLQVRTEVLDFDRFAGGITPTELGGGQQTLSIRFAGMDGREYAFRVIDKDASRTLDPALRESIAARVLQDQISALLPAGALVVSRLLAAAGVLHAEPRMFVMPDEPRLGEHRQRFAGLLGFMEERPDEGPDGEPGFAGATIVVGSESFFDRLEADPRNVLDEAVYVRARLVDAFVGDWDRHPDQWRWAGFEEDGITRWEPIPRDRDWALARLDGLLPWIAGFAFPNYVGFDDDYPSAFRLSWTGRALDRRLLAGTPRSTFDSTAADLVRRLDDRVIADAVDRLPTEYRSRVGDRLAGALRARRDDLPRYAREYYQLLAGWVDIHTTDEDETATVERSVDGRLVVQVGRRNAGDLATPTYSRTFAADETREVRLFMHGGDDQVLVQGDGRADIIVRVVGGGSDDELTDRTGGNHVFFYDDRGDNRFQSSGRTRIDTASYEAPEVSNETAQAPPRDWGAWWIPVPYAAFEPDVGFYVGMGAIRYGYGFRYAPWKTRLSVSAGFGTGAGGFRGVLDYDFPLYRELRGRFIVRYSDADRDNFFGFGNETRADSSSSFYRADRRDFSISARMAVKPAAHFDLSVGPVFRVMKPFSEDDGALLDTLDVYGEGRFDEIGLTGGLIYDARNHVTAATRGVFLRVDGRFFPGLLDVKTAFGSLAGEAAVYLSPDTVGKPVLALRVAGRKTWGTTPFQEAAYLGGASTLRGYANQRFVGEAAAFGNVEVRIPVAGFFLTLPGQFGVFGVADAGRVFVDGEDSDEWHGSAGGGIWISALHSANVITAAVVRSTERVGVYVRAGFAF